MYHEYSFIGMPWLIYMCAMTHSYVCHDSFICVPWLIRMCAMTHLDVCHDSFVCVPLIGMPWVMAHIRMSHGTHINESWHTYEWGSIMSTILIHGTNHKSHEQNSSSLLFLKKSAQDSVLPYQLAVHIPSRYLLISMLDMLHIPPRYIMIIPTTYVTYPE